MEDQKKELTYGEKAVGITFNPSGLVSVEVVKANTASIIDNLNQTRIDATDPEVKRYCSIAITELQTACMWAIKALTYKP